MDALHSQELKKPDQCDKHGEFTSTGYNLLNKRLIWSGCPACAKEAREQHDRERAEYETRQAQERYENRLNYVGIPHRFRTKTFDTYRADSAGQEKAKAVAMQFASQFDKHLKEGSVLVFSGKPGTGKSHLALAIALHLLQTHSAMYMSAIDAVRMIRNTWHRGSEQSETDVLNTLANLDLLILDEIGVQYGTEAEQVTLFDIIDKRYRDQRPMILLTNLNAKGMKEFLGDRSFDRLREAGQWITFDWESQRGAA